MSLMQIEAELTSLDGAFEPPVMAWTGGQWRTGYLIRWFHETVEWLFEPGPGGYAVSRPLFYHEHKRRGTNEHHINLPILPDGKH